MAPLAVARVRFEQQNRSHSNKLPGSVFSPAAAPLKNSHTAAYEESFPGNVRTAGDDIFKAINSEQYIILCSAEISSAQQQVIRR